MKSIEEKINNINNLSEDEQIYHIKDHNWIISYIKKPTERVQLAAVKISGWAIENIKEPTELVQIEAINNLDYFEEYEDRLVEKYITSEKAKELYNRLKKVYGVMK
jgi:hypothetical protein